LSEGESRGHTHPAVFFFLFLPFGAIPGYVTVTLAYLLAQAGMNIEAVAGLTALAVLPHTWKVLWAPIVDTTLSARRWYMVSAAASAACLAVLATMPVHTRSSGLLETLILAASIAGTFIGMATERLMAHTVANDHKGRASGWAQAGNVAGTSIGGGAVLWLAAHYAVWSAGVVLAAASLLCCAALLFVAKPRVEEHVGFARQNIAELGRDVWSVARSRAGVLTLLLLVLPIGSGGAPQLVAAIAGDWKADADTVALARGVLGGVLALAGSLLGGYLSDWIDRRLAFLVYGMGLAACAMAMALAPHTSGNFSLFVCAYSFINGFVFAGFSALVLDTIGTGAAATKFNLMASLANLPAFYMTKLDGWVQPRWGSDAILFTDAALAVTGAGLFLLVATLAGRGNTQLQR
jgi:predicted MFS family arabinose efflux permease